MVGKMTRYLLTTPPPIVPGTDAVVQEVEALRRHFGGELVWMRPSWRARARYPRALLGLHCLRAIRENDLAPGIVLVEDRGQGRSSVRSYTGITTDTHRGSTEPSGGEAGGALPAKSPRGSSRSAAPKLIRQSTGPCRDLRCNVWTPSLDTSTTPASPSAISRGARPLEGPPPEASVSCCFRRTSRIVQSRWRKTRARGSFFRTWGEHGPRRVEGTVDSAPSGWSPLGCVRRSPSRPRACHRPAWGARAPRSRSDPTVDRPPRWRPEPQD